MANANNLPGTYIVLDGIVGCGKSVQIAELKKHLPIDFPEGKFNFTYEPGGNPEADEIRKRVKYEKMSFEEETKLFAESRNITIPQIVIPTLKRGEVLLSDRSVTTSLAYLAFGRELGLRKVWEANNIAVRGILPDYLVYIKVGLEASLKRSAGDNPDKYDSESRDFWKRCVAGYDGMVSFLGVVSPETRVITIDDPEGKLSIEATRLVIKESLYPIIEGSIRREGRISRDRQV